MDRLRRRGWVALAAAGLLLLAAVLVAPVAADTPWLPDDLELDDASVECS